MTLQKLDLNLLKVFEAIYRIRNLTLVAHQVNLTQPAVSHALARMRQALDDQLFVRTPNGLEPTARSEALILPIRQALQLIHDSVFASTAFSPESCDREIRLLLSDVGELVFLPRLLGQLREIAPFLRLTVIQADITRYDAMLRDREAELALGNLPSLSVSLKHRQLFIDRFVVIKALVQGKRNQRVTLEQYKTANHVLVTPPGSPVNLVEAALAKLKIARNVVLHVPHYFAVPSVVLNSDLMVTVPASVANNLRNADGLHVSETPFASPTLHVNMFWHIRQDKDPVHRWFRQVMVSLFSR